MGLTEPDRQTEQQKKAGPASARPWLLILLLVAVTLTVYWPVIGHEFINWDDPDLLTQNPGLNPVTWSNVASFWREPYAGLYTPLSYTFWAGLTFLGRGPHIFHAANLALHLCSAVLVFLILRTLVKCDWSAWFGAALFAIHPLQVEAVGWVSGMNGLLCGALSLAAMMLFLSRSTRRALIEVSATCMFVLALLAKPSAVVVPLMLAPIIWLRESDFRRRRLILLGTWFFLAGLFVWIAVRVQQAASVFAPPMIKRPLIALDAIAFYLWKLIAPIGLAVDYGRTTQWVMGHGALYFTWLAPALLLILCATARSRKIMTCALVFVAALLPVLGLVPFDFQHYSTVSDRYVYLAMLGPAMLACFLMSKLKDRAACVIAALVLLLLGILAHHQVWQWRDTFVLFQHNLKVNPNSLAANYALGQSMAQRGEIEQATRYYERALAADPADPATHYNYGNLLLADHPAEALRHYRVALASRPNDARLQNNCGVALANLGQFEDAAGFLVNAIALSRQQGQEYAEAHLNLGLVLARSGHDAEAIVQLKRALAANPNLAAAQRELQAAMKRRAAASQPK